MDTIRGRDSRWRRSRGIEPIRSLGPESPEDGVNVKGIFGRALAFAAGGYVAGVLLGIGLVQAFSQNRHDKSMEAGMTGFFFAGPAVAVLAFAFSLVWQLIARRNR